MGLQEIKLKEVLRNAFRKLLRKGTPPSFKEISKEVEDIPLALPTTLPIEFSFLSKFDHEKYNSFLESSESDFKVLYRGLYEQLSVILSLLEKRNTELSKAIKEASIVEDLLENEIHLSQYSNGYFYSFFDTFKTVNNIDLSKSTISIDLGTESVRLKRDTKSSKKIDLSGISNEEIAIEVEGDSVLRGEGNSSEVTNIFNSLDTVWSYIIVSSSSSKVDLIITFPFPKEEIVSAVNIDTFLPKESLVSVELSKDEVNYQSIGTKNTVPGSITRFVNNLKGSYKSIKIIISRKTADESRDNTEYIYRFPIREISVFKESFQESGDLYSKLLSVPDSSLFIDKVSLVTEEDVPDGTSIKYFIATDINPNTWLPISPINRPDESKNPRVINFRQLVNIPAFSNLIDISSSSVTPYSFPDGSSKKNGITFYKVASLSNTPQQGSVEIYRGINGWRNTKKEGPIRIKEERDNYVVFSNRDSSQQFYINVYNEELTVSSNSDGNTETKLNPKYPLLVDPSFKVSSANTNQNSPNYVIGKLIQKPSSNVSRSYPIKFSKDPVGSIPGVTIRIGSASEGLEGKKLVVFTDELTTPSRRLLNQNVKLNYQTLYGNNINDVFTIEQVLVKNGNTVFVLDDPYNRIKDADSNSNIDVTILSLDVTEDISNSDENTIYLDPSLEVKIGDYFVADYRRQLTKSEEIIDSSIVVKDGIDSSVEYEFGKDYVVDFVNKTITITSDGSIQPGDVSISVRLSFQYKSRSLNLYTYETNIVVPQTGIKTTIQPLQLTSNKESSVIIGVDGEIDLTSTTKLELLPGTYTVRVVSTIPRILSNGLINQDSAIYKTINLKDANNNYVFNPKLYFERIQGWIEPLKEVSMFDLTSNTYKEDHSKFSIDGSDIVMNFNPTAEDSLYLVPGSSIVSRKETFAVGYTYAPSLDKNVSGVYFRASMRKSLNSNFSPELYSYRLRFSHGKK